MCSIPRRRVRGSVAWVLFIVEGFEVWARPPTPHNPLPPVTVAWAFVKVEGFEVWARVFDSRSKGSRFGRLGFFKVEGFEV